MSNIIKFFSENLYYAIILVTIIALIIFYIIGSKKKKEKERIENEELLKNKIEAPNSKRRFVQGQVIKEQDLSINHIKKDDN